jgi:ribosomal protein S18 acetylase RimI-like enzyme
MSIIKKLNWDSDFFNIEIGSFTYEEDEKFSLQEIHNLIKDSSYDLIYIFKNLKFFPPTFTPELNLVDTKVIFKKNITNLVIDTPKIEYYDKLNKPRLKEIYNLAYNSGFYSRFKLDERFKPSDFVKLYKKWVDNCIDSNTINDLLVYVEDNQLLGFVTVNYSKKKATIGLIAVNHAFRGKSIGSTLMKKVEYLAMLKGCFTVEVATQLENEEACAFYKKNNYQVSEMKNIYHIWK